MNNNDLESSLKKAYPHLLSYAYYLTRDKIEREDLTQDTILKILENKDKAQVDNNFKAWCVSIMHNLYNDKLKARNCKKRAGIHIDIQEAKNVSYQSSDNVRAHINHISVIKGKLAQKKRMEYYKTLFILLHFGLTYSEIATFTSKKIGTIKYDINYMKKLINDIVQIEL